MRAVLPGKPQAKLQAVCTGQYEGKRLIVSIAMEGLQARDPVLTILRKLGVHLK
jgi:hypothetical protein